MLTWMVGNTVVRPNAKDEIFPRKETDEKKIDGTVALSIAMNRALAAPQQFGPMLLTF
jgi:phage terminase large subunit-like protein